MVNAWIADVRVGIAGTDPLQSDREGDREESFVLRGAPVRPGYGTCSRLPPARQFVRMVEQDAVVGVENREVGQRGQDHFRVYGMTFLIGRVADRESTWRRLRQPSIV